MATEQSSGQGLTVTLDGQAQKDASRIIDMFGGGISDQAACTRALHILAELLEHHITDGGEIHLKGGKVRGVERLRFL